MGLYTIGLQQQQRGASAGTKVFPDIGSVTTDQRIRDSFKRVDLAPTNAYVIYTTSTTGSGTAAIASSLDRFDLTTGSTAGNDVSTRVSNIGFYRGGAGIFQDNTRSLIEIDILFNLGNVVGVETFIGLMTVNTALTVLPTTARHLGLRFDDSAENNWILTSADGTTQSTTDTSVAASSSVFRLNISWTGDDSAELRLFGGTNATVQQGGTHTVTAFGGAARTGIIHFFVQAEGATAESLRIHEWSSSAS